MLRHLYLWRFGGPNQTLAGGARNRGKPRNATQACSNTCFHSVFGGPKTKLAFFGVFGVRGTSKTRIWEQCPQMLAGEARKNAKCDRLCSFSSGFCSTISGSTSTSSSQEESYWKAGTAQPEVLPKWALATPHTLAYNVSCVPHIAHHKPCLICHVLREVHFIELLRCRDPLLGVSYWGACAQAYFADFADSVPGQTATRELGRGCGECLPGKTDWHANHFLGRHKCCCQKKSTRCELPCLASNRMLRPMSSDPDSGVGLSVFASWASLVMSTEAQKVLSDTVAVLLFWAGRSLVAASHCT